MTDAAEKVRRHRAIAALVREQAIASQEALARALARRGFPVTQATLSRDLRDLRIARVPVEGGFRYQPAAEPAAASADAAEARRLGQAAALEVTGIEANEQCVVVRTLAGRAQGIGVWLDGLALPDALATIAGDDTILVLPRSVRHTERLRKTLVGLFGERH
jgi:transcriptional regulator of arginine metabolism